MIFFFFHDPATTEIYTLSLHDALPISGLGADDGDRPAQHRFGVLLPALALQAYRSEEHTSELQSRENLVCRLLLEKKKNTCQFYLLDEVQASLDHTNII